MLDLEGQKLKFSASNIGKTALIDKIIGDVADLQGDKLLDWFFNQLDKNGKLNRSYFNTVVPDKKPNVQKAYQKSFDNILTRFGYDGKKFVKGGVLHDITRIADPIRKIKAEAVKAIASGSSYKDFVDQMDTFVQGTPEKSGVIESHFRTNAYDTFQMVDRSLSLNMAKSLGLKKFVYSGTEMETTRQFCKAKIGKVFTIEDAEGWKDEEWQGKPKTNYDPILDMGGYNCTHVPDWITDDMADEIEKVEINKNAKIDQQPDSLKSPKNEIIKSFGLEQPSNNGKGFVPNRFTENYVRALGIEVDDTIFGLLKEPINWIITENIGKKGAYFNIDNNVVVIPLDERRKRSKWYSENVVYHEYGHAIDEQNTFYKSDVVKDKMSKWSEIFDSNSDKYRKIEEELFNAHEKAIMSDDYDQAEKIGCILDTMKSINIRFGEGHSDAYFNQKWKKEREFIAHVFEAKFIDNDIFRKYLPELYQEMKDLELKINP